MFRISPVSLTTSKTSLTFFSSGMVGCLLLVTLFSITVLRSSAAVILSVSGERLIVALVLE